MMAFEDDKHGGVVTKFSVTVYYCSLSPTQLVSPSPLSAAAAVLLCSAGSGPPPVEGREGGKGSDALFLSVVRERCENKCHSCHSHGRLVEV